MSTTSRISSTTLETGSSVSSAVIESQKQMTLTVSLTKLGAADLLMRVYARDPDTLRRISAMLTLSETGSFRLFIDSIQGDVEIIAECVAGKGTVAVVQEVGSAEDLELADFPAGVFAASAAGRAPFADGLITAAKLGSAAVTTAKLDAGAVTAPKLNLSGLKFLVGDGVDASSGDAQATFTGAVVGDRVVAVVGQTKAADGNAQAALNSFFSLAVGTDTESVVTVTNKIVFKQAAGDKSTITYFAILAPAAA